MGEAKRSIPPFFLEGGCWVTGQRIACRYLLSLVLIYAEAAVVLDLLLSLPEELVFLDIKKLRSHMNKCYMELNSHYAGEKSIAQADSSQPNSSSRDICNASLPMYQITNCHPQNKDAGSTDSSSADALEAPMMDWKALGIRPVNSFLIPLDILARKT